MEMIIKLGNHTLEIEIDYFDPGTPDIIGPTPETSEQGCGPEIDFTITGVKTDQKLTGKFWRTLDSEDKEFYNDIEMDAVRLRRNKIEDTEFDFIIDEILKQVNDER